MKKVVLLILIIFSFILFGCTENNPLPNDNNQVPQIDQNDLNKITNFEECMLAGYPIMESYPRQCSDGNTTFVEIIQNEPIEEPADTNNAQVSETPLNKKPTLYNLGITFGDYDSSTKKAGDFLFVKSTFNNKIIIESGTLVVNDNGKKRLPEITFLLPIGTPVVSPVNGIVSSIGIIDWSKDNVVTMKENNSTEWMTSFEHLINVKVKEGDIVKVGDVIGEAAPWGEWTLGFTELVVWKGGPTDKDIIKVCPFSLLAPELKEDYENKVLALINDWENYKGKKVYDTNLWVQSLCLFEELTEYEAMNPSG